MCLELVLKVLEVGIELFLCDGLVCLVMICSVVSVEVFVGDWLKLLLVNLVSELDLVNVEKIGFCFEWVGVMFDISGKNFYLLFW